MLFLCVVSTYLLLWLAIINGYPIFYFDSSLYLKASFTMEQPIFRTIGYSVFIRLVNLADSPWFIVIVQSAIVIFILYLTFDWVVRELLPAERRAPLFLALVLLLSAGTTLPWFVGQIMPDVFTGLALLSFLLLLYHPAMKLKWSILTSLVLCISVAAHITHLLAIGALLLLVLLFRIFPAFRQFWPTRSFMGIAALVLLPLVTVATLTAWSNRRVGLGFCLSPARHVFLFARLVESGLASAFLQEQCKVEKLTPCKYLSNLPPSANDLLWTPSYPILADMGGWYGARAEARKIVSGTIWYNPVGFGKECLKQMFRQFVSFAPGVENEPLQHDNSLDDFRKLYPAEIPRYELSRQSAGKLQKDGKRLTGVYSVVFWCSLGLSVIAFLTRALRRKAANQLFILTLVFLFVNALITGALSCVIDRYQARASWLMAVCCFAYTIPLFVARWYDVRRHQFCEPTVIQAS
jgi:hypothetical protein